jgi:hypothetical protein
MSNITTPESTTAAIGSAPDDQGEPDQAGVDRSEPTERDRREQTHGEDARCRRQRELAHGVNR